jgi:hypothetical protein
MRKHSKAKRNDSALTLQEAMSLLGREASFVWDMAAPPRPPSPFLQEAMRRLKGVDLQTSEQAKTLLIDALFAELVSQYTQLKIWKAAPLQTDRLAGVADYLMAPHRAYRETPLLCGTEAKRDDFEKGRIQCLAERYACQWNNRQQSVDVDIYGIVSSGQGWVFYKLTQSGDIYETSLYGFEALPDILGALDYVFGQCP